MPGFFQELISLSEICSLKPKQHSLLVLWVKVLWCSRRWIKCHPLLLLWLLNQYCHSRKSICLKFSICQHCCLSNSFSGEPVMHSCHWFLPPSDIFCACNASCLLNSFPEDTTRQAPIRNIWQEGLFVCLNALHLERGCDLLKCNP